MTELTTVQLNAPYLILIGDLTDPTYAKTGFGIVDWRPDQVTGQLRFEGCWCLTTGGRPLRKPPVPVWISSAACISDWRSSRKL